MDWVSKSNKKTTTAYFYMEEHLWLSLVLYLTQENVGRAAASERMVLDIRRKDCRISMKVLIVKTFKFVDHIILVDLYSQLSPVYGVSLLFVRNISLVQLYYVQNGILRKR